MLEGNESGVIESSQLGEKRSSLNVGCEVQDLTLIILEDRIEVILMKTVLQIFFKWTLH